MILMQIIKYLCQILVGLSLTISMGIGWRMNREAI